MASNKFGTHFQITTWGESHGKALGVVIDGCPAGLLLSEEDIQSELDKRAPGRSPYTSPRKEPDRVEILSGIFEGVTTGAPLSLVIWNRDVDSSPYEGLKHVLRPGHANYTYLVKYGQFDYRGGGRASARETVCRVAAGAVAKKVLETEGILFEGRVIEVGGMLYPTSESQKALEKALQEGDSLGGVTELIIRGVPAGLGDPVYEKLEANLAKAMLSIPASKGFEIGEGFQAAKSQGSLHNDCFIQGDQGIETATNHAGGTLAGISTGQPIVLRVAFKPTSSIKKEQETVTTEGEKISYALPFNARHDPCLALRTPAIVEAMGALVIVDAWLMNRLVKVCS